MLSSQSVLISSCLDTIVILKYYQLKCLLGNMDIVIKRGRDTFNILMLQSEMYSWGRY